MKMSLFYILNWPLLSLCLRLYLLRNEVDTLNLSMELILLHRDLNHLIHCFLQMVSLNFEVQSVLLLLHTVFQLLRDPLIEVS